MKYIFASDVHGSSKYLNILLQKFEESKADKLVLLGDLYYHGPRNPLPEEYSLKDCIKALNNIKDKLIVVQGNCDAEVDQMVSEFPIIKDVIISVDGLNLFLTHGHIYGPKNIPANAGDVLLYGHYHVTNMEKKDNVYLLSPGSISLPKNDTKRAYIVYENRTFTLKDLLNDEVISSLSI